MMIAVLFEEWHTYWHARKSTQTDTATQSRAVKRK